MYELKSSKIKPQNQKPSWGKGGESEYLLWEREREGNHGDHAHLFIIIILEFSSRDKTCANVRKI